MKKDFIAINDVKEKSHPPIDNNDTPHELEGLRKDDYNDLVSLVNEEPGKETMAYSELKSSLGRWFTK